MKEIARAHKGVPLTHEESLVKPTRHSKRKNDCYFRAKRGELAALGPGGGQPQVMGFLVKAKT